MMNKSDSATSGPLKVGPRSWGPFFWLTLGIAGAVWQLALKGLIPPVHGIPNTALITLLFLAAAAVTTNPIPARYKWSMVAGLAFSSLGDAFLMQKRDCFVPGLASFLIAHLCYLWAFTSDCRLARKPAPFAAYGAIGVALVSWLWQEVPSALRVPVSLYAATIMLMAAQAAGRALTHHQLETCLAGIGAALFVISDGTLAAGRFGHRFDYGHLVVLSTYFAAQACLALSVVLYGSSPLPTQEKTENTSHRCQ